MTRYVLHINHIYSTFLKVLFVIKLLRFVFFSIRVPKHTVRSQQTVRWLLVEWWGEETPSNP